MALDIQFKTFEPVSRGGMLPVLVVGGVLAAAAIIALTSKKKKSTLEGRWPGPQIELFPYDYYQSLYR